MEVSRFLSSRGAPCRVISLPKKCAGWHYPSGDVIYAHHMTPYTTFFPRRALGRLQVGRMRMRMPECMRHLGRSLFDRISPVILSIFCWASNCTLIHIFQMIIFSSKMLQIRCSTPLNALENAREFEYPIIEAIGTSII